MSGTMDDSALLDQVEQILAEKDSDHSTVVRVRLAISEGREARPMTCPGCGRSFTVLGLRSHQHGKFMPKECRS